MPKGKENTQGRGLEYAFVEEFRKAFPEGTYDGDRTAALKNYFDNCEPTIREKFSRACRVFWGRYRRNKSYETVALKFQSDSQAARRGVPDLVLTLDDMSQKISVKHNNDAMRHPRVHGTMQHLGFPLKSREDVSFRSELESMRSAIGERVIAEFGCVVSYPEMGDWKSVNVYQPITAFLADTLRKFESSKPQTRAYFTFLWGGDHVKAIVGSNSISVLDYRDMDEPSGMKVGWSASKPSYVDLTFDTGFEVSMRLKNDWREFERGLPNKLDVRAVTAPNVIREVFF